MNESAERSGDSSILDFETQFSYFFIATPIQTPSINHRTPQSTTQPRHAHAWYGQNGATQIIYAVRYEHNCQIEVIFKNINLCWSFRSNMEFSNAELSNENV